ncbi:acyl-CoA dehydrogenase family protein [Pseudalkalibacillus sp. A8]|uniref:acyl-CoA dehydrogenase family protein n=1 Tax=Pseudalkalibacillus sp. A8 TaxID=3382641 RepID=UPI0038B4A06C
MDFNLTEEQKMVQETVREFVQKELFPLEQDFMRNEREGRPGISDDKIMELQMKAKDHGFWGINTPEEYGGSDLGPFMTTLINMELGKTFIPFTFAGDADNILFNCDEKQKEKYLFPVINGERNCCFALTEPGAGSDARNIKMSAVKEGNHWILNGEKIFITRAHKADFAMVFAVTDKEKGGRGGVTCFLVDREMGWRHEPIPTMDDWQVNSLIFDKVKVPEENILGELGKGFELAMKWITLGRVKIGAWSIGIAERLLQMGVEQANSRMTFGKPIADYQAIQWMIADSAVEIEAAKGLVLHSAYLAEIERDARRHHASISKLYSTNMVQRVVDRVLQIHGGMGITKEFPIERWYRTIRKFRVFEGTDEILRRTIAYNLLKGHVKVGKSS